MPSAGEISLILRALLVLAIAFAVLFLLRFGSIHRARLVARWPALALAAGAIIAGARGAVEPAIGLAVLAVGAWFASPILLAPRAAQTTPPGDAEARAILGVGLAATPADIRAAYRRKIAEAHPDRGGSHDAAARLTAARDALLKRR